LDDEVQVVRLDGEVDDAEAGPSARVALREPADGLADLAGELAPTEGGQVARGPPGHVNRVLPVVEGPGAVRHAHTAPRLGAASALATSAMRETPAERERHLRRGCCHLNEADYIRGASAASRGKRNGSAPNSGRRSSRCARRGSFMHRASVPGRRNGPHGICAILNAGDRPRATAAPDRIVLLIALALLTTG